MGDAGKSGDKHLARIDVLRGVAILLVVVYHSFGATFGWNGVDWAGVFSGRVPHPGWSNLLLQPLRFGGAGVALFFVISGYVIHRSYLRDRDFRWGAYASRRFWRIYPAYIVALVGFAAWMHVLRTKDFALHALLVHNVSAETFFGINGSFWSLAVEVQLYLLYPLAILARRAWGVRGMLGFGIAASLVWRAVAAAFTDWSQPLAFHVWNSPVALWPDWLLGAYLAESHAAGQRVFHRKGLWLSAAVACLVAAAAVKPLEAVGFSVAALFAAVAMEGYLLREGSLGRSARGLTFVGVCSYSLYLLHQPLMEPYAKLLYTLGLHRPVAQLFVGFPLYILAATACSWLMYRTIELGAIRLGKWLGGAKRRTDPAPPASAEAEAGRAQRVPTGSRAL